MQRLVQSRYGRKGFTLTELLIVIAILLLLSTLALAVFNTGRSSDRMRSAARIGQSAFMGAKDRAMHAKNNRGLRLIRDPNGPTFGNPPSPNFPPTNAYPALVNGFVYIQPLDLISFGNLKGQPFQSNVAVFRPGASPDATLVIIQPSQSVALLNQDAAGVWPRSGVQVRIPSGQSANPGQWYALNFNPAATGNNYWVSKDASGNANLILQTPLVFGAPAPAPAAVTFSDSFASMDIQLGNEVLPFHQPIALPSGTVVDLRYCSTSVQYLAGAAVPNTGAGLPPNVDFSFSPRGSVSGVTGGMGALYFCLRAIEDAMGISTNPLTAGGPLDPSDPGVKGDCLILALNPQTGLVQTYDADLTDANADGYADNLFSFAQAGKAAGR